MPYRNLLVHLDDTEPCAARVAAAVALADAQDAHLTGLALAAEVSLPSYVGGQLPPEVIEMQRQAALKRAEAAGARFTEAVAKAGRSSDLRLVPALDIDVASVIALHARYADLVILGQPETDHEGPVGRHDVEEVILSCGRPAIVVPYIGAKTMGRRIMVAWDSGRESTRAVNDALPLLERADEVVVLSINPRPGIDGHGEQPGADIALHLARHDVKVEVQQTRSDDIGVGETLLSRLADAGSDLLVMGAYGHSRFRELVLGGVTRTLLQEMTIPVLMSH